ncbi:unnamed protein product [Rotaria socialis]|uniref:Uncharacterized protein n=1 Tax=Rotaria socialis TaxID=392032 RepID=A0A820H9N5_9BILA|nr:unnamed protein product [Rotaria socialis]
MRSFLFSGKARMLFCSCLMNKNWQKSATIDAVSAMIWQLVSFGGICIPYKSKRKEFKNGIYPSHRDKCSSTIWFEDIKRDKEVVDGAILSTMLSLIRRERPTVLTREADNPLGSVRNWQTTPTNTRQSPSLSLLHHHLHPPDSSTIKRAYTMARITVQSTNTSRAKPYTIQGLVETLNEFVPMSTPGYDDPRKDRSGPAACQDM